MQTLVRRDLLPEDLKPEGELYLRCIHGDVKAYPRAKVRLTIRGRSAEMVVGLATTLPYPIILGRDWPGFADLVREVTPRPPADREKVETKLLGERPPEDQSKEAPEGEQPRGEKAGEGPDDPGTPAEANAQTLTLADFPRDQREDPTLRAAYEQVAAVDGTVVDPRKAAQWPHFEVKGDRLYRVMQDPRTQEVKTQILVPGCHRRAVLRLAHDIPAAGHMGTEKTLARVLSRFFWPGVYQEVRDYCQSCPNCQLASDSGVPKAPLIPLPVVGTPFERVAMDLVGPLPKSKAGFRYILVVMDYATRFPEAIPLRNTYARTIASELVKIFARVGLPRELLTDQGTNFTSQLFRQVCTILGIHKLQTSVYHPQTDGLVERFNRTLKGMLRRFSPAELQQWDLLLPPLLLAVREVPQASTQFSPFELLYGYRPRGILDLVRETWESTPSTSQGLLQYVFQLQERLRQAGALARENLQLAQAAQERTYNRQAQERSFKPGDLVVLLLPSEESKLLARWKGPYEVIRQVGPVNYEIYQPDRKKKTQIFHVNFLKHWREREALMITPYPVEPPLGPEIPDLGEEREPQLGNTLSATQVKQARRLVEAFRKTFTTQPGCTGVITHTIWTPPGQVVREGTRPLPRRMRKIVEEEVQSMLQLGVIERSQSEWRSPIVLVPKPDGSVRFCIDFRRVNAISKFDAYPMPRTDELLERLGKADFITTLDLTKGYWQIPLDPESREKTAFSTPSGLFHFKRMPFGLHGAPATFQRMMDRLLSPHTAYAAAYLDDVVIYGQEWEEHIERVAAVMRTLRDAGLTANPTKCKIGWQETTYLGYQLGRGLVRPLVGKVEAVRNYPTPTTKKKVRQFLGLAGYYRRFVPHFATRAAPLTALLKKDSPQRIRWSPECETAFQDLKAALCSAPVLFSPDFSRPFIVQTDASDCGLGAVLSQEIEGEEHPVLYISRKLFPRERRYAAIEKEALAIKWAIEALRYYLLGDSFILFTDHAPLQWLHQMWDTNSRIMRWYLSLQPYVFTVKHRAGRDNANADALSRREEEQKPIQVLESNSIEVNRKILIDYAKQEGGTK
ncbi:uncharacterized protein LOC142829504 [Pelodiscus sinensis]|uniref:uncharacterized protein LOC142829504 n=1 Tax=Pelodiscus sinensis TaxID=13735 RepID=UPI003F6CBCBB